MQMKIKEIRELIDFISNSGLDEVNIETEEFKLSVKKNSRTANTDDVLQYHNSIPAPVTSTKASVNEVKIESTSVEEKTTSNLITIKSPMIGTFYRAANPEAEAFANVGDIINKGQVVCMVEAMKLFNEIESEVSGKIVKVLVENASPVEYDQPLFLVEPV
jgi:acetyl-CoA carboxylase biotin carboxyl carrier protein